MPPNLSRQPWSASSSRPPADFGDYFSAQEAARGRPVMKWTLQGWAAWLSWAIDGVLTLAAAVAMVLPATRLPYCRVSKLVSHDPRRRVPRATAQLMAAAAGIEVIDAGKWLRCRLSCCRGGCGPTNIELFWDSPARAGPLVRGGVARRPAAAPRDAGVGRSRRGGRAPAHGRLARIKVCIDRSSVVRIASDRKEISHR